ncbi:hypothetical protein V6N12_048684 [Hibiscus sabdariffa]|uniref:J domain-containing protein n=1 Tax=Hibiscus sabdariffa TaxID=183260 RepID=A0ABR2EIE0_9ROSI
MNLPQSAVSSFFKEQSGLAKMAIRSWFTFAFLFSLLVLHADAKAKAKAFDPYKVLGVEKNATQREIQKAFHQLSLVYHPDKNKSKGAQEKFAEINNAYDFLSDEEKRKNYDRKRDKEGATRFDAGHPGDGGGPGGYAYSTSSGPGQSEFTSGPGGSQHMGGQGSSWTGFNIGDLFSKFFGGFSGSSWSQSQSESSPKSIRAISSNVFEKEISDQGMTWLLLSHTPSSQQGKQNYESIMEEVASLLQGAIRVGSINCETEYSLCKDLGMLPGRAPRLFVYSYKVNEKGSLKEYKGDLVTENAETFCQYHLPRFSERISLNHFDLSSSHVERYPVVMLLSTRKDTPVIWRVLSGLYHKRFTFYDAEVHDVSEPDVKKLGVGALPAVIGWLSNGEKHILKSGISVKDLKSAIEDLSSMLHRFEKKNKKVASSKQTDSAERQLPLLTASNSDALCGDKTPVCIIGAFRKTRSRERLESLLFKVSQKSLSRRKNVASGSKDSVSYSLLDARKQASFLSAFDKSGYKSSSKILVAFKPRKGKFAAFKGHMNVEKVERFISSVLSGDVKFSRTRQKPVLK